MSTLTAYDKFIQCALKYGFAPLGLPRTGQLVSYADYDDGYYKAGYPVSGARFVDNGDGTVTDRGTGLMIQQDWGTTNINWYDALIAAHALTLAGHTDWRLPNMFEMFTLYSAVCYEPIAPAEFFYNITETAYESSTTHTLAPTYMIVLDMYAGGFMAKGKTALGSMFCVRAGVTII